MEISFPSSVKKIQRRVKFLQQEDNICRHDFTKQNYVKNINTTKVSHCLKYVPPRRNKCFLIRPITSRRFPYLNYIYHIYLQILVASADVTMNTSHYSSSQVVSVGMICLTPPTYRHQCGPHPKPVDKNKNAFLVACVLRHGTKSTFLVAKESFVVGFCLLVVCQRSQVFDSFRFQ